jgi:hypothetical protein
MVEFNGDIMKKFELVQYRYGTYYPLQTMSSEAFLAKHPHGTAL